MTADGEGQPLGLHMAVQVGRRTLRAVDAYEGAEAVVDVHAESVGSGDVHVEGDADMERDIIARTV